MNIPFRGWTPKSYTGVLPTDAEKLLREAASQPEEIRRMAVDAAIDRVKFKYPQLFI